MGQDSIFPGETGLRCQRLYTTATIDAKGQGVPVVQPVFYQRPFSAAKLDWRSKWIWSHKGSGPDEYNVWFQKEIELEDEPEYGAIATLGDDHVYTYVNDKFMGKHRGWRTSVFYDITQALRKGKNRITVRMRTQRLLRGRAVAECRVCPWSIQL